MELRVDGRACWALIDTGCTDTIVHAPYCTHWQPRATSITTISGDKFTCVGIGSITVEAPTGQRAQLHALVADKPPLGMHVVLGMSGISALGGVVVKSPSQVSFCGARQTCSAAVSSELEVDAPDFSVRFDAARRVWTVAWKWANEAAPHCLNNTIAQYNVAPSMRQEFNEELETWMKNGWLVEYDEGQHGPPRGLLPLMAVKQNNGCKVRPVLDYRELNDYVTAFTADSDVCADQLRKWRRHGQNIAVLDLRKAYLQVHVAEQLWPFQTVVVRGRRYCLTRLGFGLNVAPQVMKAVVKAILARDPTLERAVLPYVDDLLVDEDQVSAEKVAAHFAAFGLECKPPARTADGARLLGLHVKLVNGQLRWTRDNPIDPPPTRVTRRAVFAWCGRLVAHLPVGSWLRPAIAWLKRRANAVTCGWDDVVEDGALNKSMQWVSARLAGEDPCRGSWSVSGDKAVVWTDASSVATGIVIETPRGDVIEDACWLRRDDSTHINMAELDAAVRGVNLALAWGMRTIELKTDSAAVHHWIDDALSGRARLRTKAHGEMLIRRRVDIIKQLVSEMKLNMSVSLVRSAANHADALTRVPEEWLRNDNTAVAAAAVGEEDTMASRVASVHVRAGHPGIRRTLFFARREVSRAVTRAEAREAVKQCDACRAIDPAPVKWPHGSLGVPETWWRLAIDVTHYLGHAYLSIIDCGPSRFCLWRQLRRPDADTVADHLEQIFYERGSPVELLCDNDTVFRGRRLAALAARWSVSLRFRAAYAPSGNGIVERNHRTVKVIAARKRCSVAEAVHLYNVSPRDGTTVTDAPARGVYCHEVRDCVRDAEAPVHRTLDSTPCDHNSGYAEGDQVWVRKRGERCTSESQTGVITKVNSPQVVEVDGVPRHIRDVRHRNVSATPSGKRGYADAGDEPPLYVYAQMQQPQPYVPQVQQQGVAHGPGRAETPEEGTELRRSARVRRPPQRLGYVDLGDQGGV